MTDLKPLQEAVDYLRKHDIGAWQKTLSNITLIRGGLYPPVSELDGKAHIGLMEYFFYIMPTGTKWTLELAWTQINHVLVLAESPIECARVATYLFPMIATSTNDEFFWRSFPKLFSEGLFPQLESKSDISLYDTHATIDDMNQRVRDGEKFTDLFCKIRFKQPKIEVEFINGDIEPIIKSFASFADAVDAILKSKNDAETQSS